MGRLAALLAIAVGPIASGAEPDHPWLDGLDAGEGVRESGARLMSLPPGLHALERDPGTATALLVGIHGYASRGYEWVYPLQTMDDDATAVTFFRWDFTGCPGAGAAALTEALADVPGGVESLEAVRIVGHSYGGVMALAFAAGWSSETPLEVHAVAAPLAGMEALTERCDYAPPASLPPGVAVFEWRTRHDLDNAFARLPEDPQEVEITGSAVTRLPGTYRGRRLGHNWSVSWVADTLAGRQPAP